MKDTMWALAAVLARQSGVIRRSQILAAGFGDRDIDSLLRRRDLARVHLGVYVDHTGPLSWDQRSWAAVLACWPAALRGASARRSSQPRLLEAADDGRPISVVVAAERHRRRDPQGVGVRRSRTFDHEIDWSALPPRQHNERWVLDLAGEAATDVDAVAVVADAVGARLVRPESLRRTLDGLSRISRRRFLEGVVDDAAAGTCSVLEHGYLTRVERPHGLPCAARQVRASAKGAVYRDVEYRGLGIVVELDGRLHHSGIRNRDRDLERDLDAAADGLLSVRLGWGQVYGGQCATAARLALILRSRGWPGTSRRCPACPPPG